MTDNQSNPQLDSRRVYKVTTTFTALVYAYSSEQAKDDLYINQMIALETPKVQATMFRPYLDDLPTGWTHDSLLYHKDESNNDISVKQGLASKILTNSNS